MIPYVHPLLDGFASPHFLDTAEAKRKEMIAALGQTFGSRLKVDEHWARVKGALREESDTWQPKVYMCVGRRSFWPTVSALTRSPELMDVCSGFKVFAASLEDEKYRRAYRRPDKIVFYAPQPVLGRLLRRLSGFVRGRQSHGLRHTGRPAAYGLPEERGLYVGLDPLFLGRSLSWRIYRSVAIHWFSLNRDFVEERWGADAWLRRMNLDVGPEGPRSLRPPARDHAFIRDQWAEMFAEGARL